MWTDIGSGDFTDVQLYEFIAAAIAKAKELLALEGIEPTILDCATHSFASIHIHFQSSSTNTAEQLRAAEILQVAVDQQVFEVSVTNGTSTVPHLATFWDGSTATIVNATTTTLSPGSGSDAASEDNFAQKNFVTFLVVGIILLLLVVLVVIMVVRTRTDSRPKGEQYPDHYRTNVNDRFDPGYPYAPDEFELAHGALMGSAVAPGLEPVSAGLNTYDPSGFPAPLAVEQNAYFDPARYTTGPMPVAAYPNAYFDPHPTHYYPGNEYPVNGMEMEDPRIRSLADQAAQHHYYPGQEAHPRGAPHQDWTVPMPPASMVSGHDEWTRRY